MKLFGERQRQRGLVTNFTLANSQYLVSDRFPHSLRDDSSSDVLPYSVATWWYAPTVSIEMGIVWVGDLSVSNQGSMLGIQYYNSQGYPCIDMYSGGHLYERTGNYAATYMWNHTVWSVDALGNEVVLVHNGDWASRGISLTPQTPNYSDTEGDMVVAFGRRNDSSPGDPFGGFIAYPTMWQGPLYQRDILRLAAGVHPLEINPRNLIMHVPLTGANAWTDVIEGIQMKPMGSTGTPVTISSNTHVPMLSRKMRPALWMVVGQAASAINLTVDNLSQATTVQKVAITTVYNASIDDLSQSSTVEKFSLAQLHILAVDGLSQSNTVEHLELSTESALALGNLSQSSAVDKFSITQLHNLQVKSLSQSSTVTKLLLEAEGYLAVFSLSQSNTVDHITTTKQSDIDAYDLSQSTTVTKIALSSGVINLTVANLSQANSLSALGVFIQYATIYPRALSIDISVNHLSLTSIHNLDVDNLEGGTLLDVVAVWANNNMSVADLSQSSSITTTTFTQVHNLVVPGAYINTTVEYATLWDWWYETIDEIGSIVQEISMVGYIEKSYEGTGYIRQTEEQNGLITQEVSEDGSIVQEYDVEGPITRTYEQVGEI